MFDQKERKLLPHGQKKKCFAGKVNNVEPCTPRFLHEQRADKAVQI